jgi:hypothetical protein
MGDPKLPPQWNWYFLFSGLLNRIRWFETYVSGVLYSLTLVERADRKSGKVVSSNLTPRTEEFNLRLS